MKKAGLIINPIAGMGGRVGLKGTDGPEILAKARTLGAKPEAAGRTLQALQELAKIKDDILLITCPGAMGAETAIEAGFRPELLTGISEPSTADDTEKAARDMAALEVDLIIFAGGDGTARNIYNALGESSSIPVIGIPAGVKIHSAVYATNPRNAGILARQFLQNSDLPLRRAEVMDIDEEAFRSGSLEACLYGYLSIPCTAGMMQHLKIGGAVTEESVFEAIAEHVIEMMEPDVLYIIGPGSTTVPIMKQLGLKYTLLGVDVVLNRQLAAADAGEKQLLKLLEKNPARIVVTVIGGQGYIFGRGNQQISAEVIKKAGRKNIIVVAAREKILSLENPHLLVDTGDEEVNIMLSGYIKIITGYHEELIYRITG